MKRVSLTFVALLVCTAIAHTSLAQRPQRPGGQPGAERGRFNPLIRLFDTNADGVLSAKEIADAGKKLGEFDKSGDGQLTGAELQAAMPFGGGRAGGPGGRPPQRPGGPGRGGPGRGGPGGGVSADELQGLPLGKDDQEKRILAALDTMREGVGYRNVSSTDGRLLRLLAETIDAKRVVEIGTSTGESAVWLALGLRKTGGHLYTHEINEERAKIAKENFKKAGVDDLITLVFGDAHETVKQYDEPIDILFLDADKEGYIDYLKKLNPLLRPGALVIAHNMNTRQADSRFVQAITKNPDLESLILLKEGTGVSVTLKKR